MGSLNSRLRTVDVARAAGYSVQQIRDLERDGVLPAVPRTPAGYRRYTAQHVQAALAYRAVAAGVGPVEAKHLLRAAVGERPAECLALLDDLHARLATERRDLGLARAACAAITAEPVDAPRPTDSMSISELAGALGVRPSTLRHWEAEGLLVPGRSAGGRARSYSPGDVRDARIVHQLRHAGYRIGPLRALLPQLRRARRWNELGAVLAERDDTLTARSRALLRGAAALDVLLSAAGPPPTDRADQPRGGARPPSRAAG